MAAKGLKLLQHFQALRVILLHYIAFPFSNSKDNFIFPVFSVLKLFF